MTHLIQDHPEESIGKKEDMLLLQKLKENADHAGLSQLLPLSNLLSLSKLLKKLEKFKLSLNNNLLNAQTKPSIITDALEDGSLELTPTQSNMEPALNLSTNTLLEMELSTNAETPNVPTDILMDSESINQDHKENSRNHS